MDSNDIQHWLEVTEATVREARSKGHNIKCRYCGKEAGPIYKTGHEFWGMCWDCWSSQHVEGDVNE